jgi:hypothetical protein
MNSNPRLAALMLAGLLASGAHAAGPDEVARSPTEVHPLLVGAAAPSAQVRAPDGTAADLREVVTEKPTVLLFYRGGW